MEEWLKEEEEDHASGSVAAFVAGFGVGVVENWGANQEANCHHLLQKFVETLAEGHHHAVS
jgi:hypothetical protein